MRAAIDKPLLNFRFPAPEDLELAAKLDGNLTSFTSAHHVRNNDIIADTINSSIPPKKEVGSIFDFLANKQMLVGGGRANLSNMLQREGEEQVRPESPQRKHDKLKEHLLNASKNAYPAPPVFTQFQKDISNLCGLNDLLAKGEDSSSEKSASSRTPAGTAAV